MKKCAIIMTGIVIGVFLVVILLGGNRVKEGNSFSTILVDNRKVVNSDTLMDIQGSVEYDIASENQFKKCEKAIYGKIIKVDYLMHHYTPWSKIQIECIKNFKGDIENKQRVSVYVMGGYLDKKSYEKKFDTIETGIDENTLIEMKYFQNELSKVGDEGMFYMVSNDDDSIFERGTYSFLCSGYSKMMYDEKSGNIKETVQEGVKNVSKEVFFSKIKSYIKEKK